MTPHGKQVLLGIALAFAVSVFGCAQAQAAPHRHQKAHAHRFVPKHHHARHRHVHRHRFARHHRRIHYDANGNGVHLVGDLVSTARQHIGQTARQVGVRRSLWCSAFMRKIDPDKPGVDDRASSWLNRPRAQPGIGKIVILRSRRDHVGVVSGFDANGNPIVISGNHGNLVAESVYLKRQVIAYVEP